jgi:hypothetical protein
MDKKSTKIALFSSISVFFILSFHFGVKDDFIGRRDAGYIKGTTCLDCENISCMRLMRKKHFFHQI